MRVAFVTPEYITEANFDGGLSNYLGRVCPALAALGHEVVVIVASEQAGQLVRDGVIVHRMPLVFGLLYWLNKLTLQKFQTATRWLLQLFALRRACKRLHRQKPFDLIQYASYTATGFLRLKNVPAVVRISSYAPLLQRAYEVPITAESRLTAWMENAAIRKADAVFGPSELIAKVVSEMVRIPVELIESPFTMDVSGWDEQPFVDQLAGRKYLLFFGTLGVLKGVQTIAEIIKPLLQSDPDLHFVFIGKTTLYKGKPIIELVWDRAEGCRGRVHYLGQMRHSQLFPILANATAVVLPSRIDNLPNACLEAMALKRVVVGTRGASFEQLINDGANGFLCNIDSAESLLATVRKALTLSEDERNKIGERAAERIAQLDPEILLPKLVDFYQTVISR